MKKRVLALLLGFVMLAAVLSACTTSSFSGINVSKTLVPGHWAITADSISGHFSQTFTFGARNVTAMSVQSANTGGTVTITLTQGNTVKTYDISGSYNGNLDLSAFAAGKVTLRLDLESVTGLNITVDW